VQIKRGASFSALLGPTGRGKSNVMSWSAACARPRPGDYPRRAALTTANTAGSLAARLGRSTSPYHQELSADKTSASSGSSMAFVVLARERDEESAGRRPLADRREDQGEALLGGMQRRLNLDRGRLLTAEASPVRRATVGVDPQSRNADLEYPTSLNRANGLTIIYFHPLHGGGDPTVLAHSASSITANPRSRARWTRLLTRLPFEEESPVPAQRGHAPRRPSLAGRVN